MIYSMFFCPNSCKPKIIMLSSMRENLRRLLFDTEVLAFPLTTVVTSPLAPVTVVTLVAGWTAIYPIGYGVCFGCMLGGKRYLLIKGFIVSKHSL